MKRTLPRAPIALILVVLMSQFLGFVAPALAQFGDFPQNGQPGPPNEAVFAMVMIVMAIAFAIGLGVAIVICVLLSGCYSRIPAQFRLMEPGMVWLMLIPLFSMVWVFFVTARLSKSFQNYFNAHGRTDVGDCAQQIGLWYSICTAACLVPCVNYVAGPAALVLLIIYLVKVMGLKNQIPMGATS